MGKPPQRALAAFLLVNIGTQIGFGIGSLVQVSYRPDMHIALSLVALGADLISAFFALLFQACFREEGVNPRLCLLRLKREV
ncbi:MAG: hypothetical protein U1E21_18520 [Reyranellaceae bacterium]|jgi:hypothetical protein